MAADQITILDGLQFAKADGYHVWTLDTATVTVVGTWVVSLPADISGARVIFNSAESTAAMRCHCRVKVTKLTGISTLTKTENTQAIEWTTVTTPEILETGAIDVSTAYEASLHIDCCLSATTAVTAGMEIIVQVRKEAALDEWTDLVRFGGPFGTGVVSHFDDAVCSNLAGQTVLGVTDPVTGKLDHVGKRIFLEDTSTIAQCEIAFLTACGTDA